MPSRPPLLDLRGVTVLRRGRRALDGVTLRIGAGENAAILGPNGSGKSTLLKLLTRELYPVATGGAAPLRILGRERWDLFELRRRLGIVSMELQADFARDLPGLDAVVSGFFGSLGTWSRQRVRPEMLRRARQALRTAEVLHLADRPMTEMSTGEVRRVLLARALVHRPGALVLDEPTSSLDLKAARDLRATLRRLARRGTSLLLVTHDVEDVVPEIGRVVLLKGGRVFRDGPRAEVLTAPALSALFGTTIRM